MLTPSSGTTGQCVESWVAGSPGREFIMSPSPGGFIL